jgi:tetratricopeptide (TPR) repeat protein
VPPPDPAAWGFVGRGRELAQLAADIDGPALEAMRGRAAGAPGCRVLLVAGRPGSGRTSLAVRFAAEVGERYPAGTLFARLTGPGGVPVPAERTARELLRGLGLTARPGAGAAETLDALSDALRDRPAVLILDDVAEPAQLTALRPSGDACLVVATAAGPLPGVPDVRPCTVGGLDPAACLDLLVGAIGEVRVTNDPRGAEALAAECAGNPTALRLVAAWLAAQPRISMAEAVRRLRAVAAQQGQQGRQGDGPADDGPVGRAFRLVHAALPKPVSRLLRLLTLAPEGLPDVHVASALAGCSVADARRTLGDLAGCGLLDAEPVPSGLPTLYRVPGWAHPRLAALLGAAERESEVRLARARMLERTVRLLHSCRLALEPLDPTTRAALDTLPRSLRFSAPDAAAGWLRFRLPALIEAARGAVADGELDTLARRLAAALTRALAADPGAAGTGHERAQLHALVLDVAVRRGLHREQAAALLSLGDLDAAEDRPLDALDRYRAALTAAREGFDGAAEGRALEAIAGTYLALDDPQRACDWYRRALALRQTRGELEHIARLHARLGALHTYAGNYGPALREWRAAATAHRRLGDLPGQARALGELARTQEYAGHPEDALRTGRDALQWARRAGDQELEAAVLLRMADTLDRLGDPAGARLQRSAAHRLLPAGAGGGGGSGEGGAREAGVGSVPASAAAPEQERARPREPAPAQAPGSAD